MHLIFLGCTLGIILKGVEGGVERASRIMMPLLLILAFIVAIYSMTRPGAGAGIYYYLVPDFSKFSIMTVVAACGQLFFSLRAFPAPASPAWPLIQSLRTASAAT